TFNSGDPLGHFAVSGNTVTVGTFWLVMNWTLGQLPNRLIIDHVISGPDTTLRYGRLFAFVPSVGPEGIVLGAARRDRPRSHPDVERDPKLPPEADRLWGQRGPVSASLAPGPGFLATFGPTFLPRWHRDDLPFPGIVTLAGGSLFMHL